ncbi:MAG: carbohydrate-binding family 9-like protein [Lentisphaeria bacterium]|nr:carbohydrate-binding family 9-like protein [Lentisphaeria bacterium]
MRTSVLSIPQVRGPLRDGLDWAADPWRESAPQSMDFVLPQTHAFRPTVQFKLARDETCVAVLFRVQDQFVRSVCREVNGPVCQDSCVEWFVQPVPGKGYFNFEVNAGGCPHISYVEDPRRLPDGGLKKRRFPTPAETAGVRVLTSLPATVEPEIQTPVTWLALIVVPFAFFELFTGRVETSPGTIWRANFHTCADHTSHPRWLSWNPVGEHNFHRPEDFGDVCFE